VSRREIFRLLATNLIVLLLSIVVDVLGNAADVDKKLFTPVLVAILCAGIVVLIVIYLAAATDALTTANAGLRKAEAAVASLPHLVRMTRRRDRFRIHPNGDAEVSWDFEVEIDAEEVTALPLPVVAERVESAAVEPAIRIRRMMVDGKDEDLQDAYLPLEVRRFMLPRFSHRQTTMDQGVLNVPLPTALGPRKVRIQVEMTLERAFTNWKSEEFAIVDTPVMTDSLRVVVEGAEGFRIVPVRRQGRHTVTATLGVVEVVDGRESDVQNRRWRRDDNRIEWGTNFPKLGYRYAIVFRMEEAENRRKATKPRGRRKSQLRAASTPATPPSDASSAGETGEGLGPA
jgi:hypothetical protein